MRELDQTKVQALSERLVDLLNEDSELVNLEKVYALCSALFSLGVAMYDRPYQGRELLEKDYKSSPTFAGAVILASLLPHELYEIFVAESQGSAENARKWDIQSLRNFVSLMEKKNATV